MPYIYTDFKKAFDKVPHQLPLQKLKLYKVDPSIYKLDQIFLMLQETERKVKWLLFRMD